MASLMKERPVEGKISDSIQNNFMIQLLLVVTREKGYKKAIHLKTGQSLYTVSG